MILRAGVAVAARFFAFAAFSAWYVVEHLFKCSCQVIFSMSVDLRWSIPVDAAHVSQSLSPLLLSLLSLSFLLLSQPLIRLELSVDALASQLGRLWWWRCGGGRPHDGISDSEVRPEPCQQFPDRTALLQTDFCTPLSPMPSAFTKASSRAIGISPWVVRKA